MSGIVEVTWLEIVLFSFLMLLPLYMLYAWKQLDVCSKAFFAAVRMILQLVLVGVYLKYLFTINHLWINIIWLLLMVTVASVSVLNGAGLGVKSLFFATQFSLMISVCLVGLLFLAIIVQPESYMDARYLIPLVGIFLGNCLQANIRALETFFHLLRDQHHHFMTRLLQGATVSEAVKPFFIQSVRASVIPTVSTMATLGLVSLPGTMTGQILAGLSPLTAAKYQIVIMVGIFVCVVLSTSINLLLVQKFAFNNFGLLKSDILKNRVEFTQ